MLLTSRRSVSNMTRCSRTLMAEHETRDSTVRLGSGDNAGGDIAPPRLRECHGVWKRGDVQDWS